MVKGFGKILSNTFLYEVENLELAPGHIRSFRRDGRYLTRCGRWSKGYKDTEGYYMMCRNVSVHRNIALCFVHNPCPGLFMIIDHIDGDPGNNDYTNLRWVDYQLNAMWRHDVEARYRKMFKRVGGKTVVYWAWVARTRFEGVEVTRQFRTQDEANAYLTTFRLSEFKRIYARKVNEYEAAKKRRLGYFYEQE